MGSEGGRERESGRTCVIESRGGSKRGNGERTTAAEEAEHYLTSALRPSFAVRDDGIAAAAKQREELHGSGPAVRSMQQRRGKSPIQLLVNHALRRRAEPEPQGPSKVQL